MKNFCLFLFWVLTIAVDFSVRLWYARRNWERGWEYGKIKMSKMQRDAHSAME